MRTTSCCRAWRTASCLRSSHAHARIVAIDTSRARALPGVYGVITGADLPRVKFGILPVSQDEEALCVEKVRMVGDAVAAVAAIDEETAERACELIDVEYEPLPALMSIEAALAHPEVRIHEYGDGPNVHKNVSLQFGDVEAAFATSRPRARGRLLLRGQHASADGAARRRRALGARTASSRCGRRRRRRTTCTGCSRRSSTCPGAHIRVIATPVGGGFGGKLDPFAHEIAACKLSQLTGRPVKIALTREEVFYVHRGRHPVLMWIKTGFTKQGDITGCHLKTWLDGGAYGSYGVASTFYTGRHQSGDVQDARLQVRGRARLHQQAAVRAQARPRHAAAALRAGMPARQGRGAARARSRGHAAPHRGRPVHEDREPPHGDHDRPRRVHRQGRRSVRLAGEARRVRRRRRRRRPGARRAPAQGHRHRVLRLHDGRRHGDLLEQHAALGRGACAPTAAAA